MEVFTIGRQIAAGLVKGVKTIGIGIEKAAPGVIAGVEKAVPLVVGGGIAVNQLLKKQMETQFPDRIPVSGNSGTLAFSSFPPRLEQKLRLLIQSAADLEDENAEIMLRDIAEQVSSDFYQILFVGAYNSGKSSLLNLLVEDSVLPVANQPTTKSLTWLLYGMEKIAFSQESGNMLKRIPFEYVRQKYEGPQQDAPLNLFAFFPAPILKRGIALIDSAGLEDPNQFAYQSTLDAVDAVDAVVLVVDPQYDHTQSYKDFVQKLKQAGKTSNLFVVLNKMDRISEEEQKKVQAAYADMLSNLGVMMNIYPLSCKNMPECDFGVARFKDALIAYMRKDDLQRARTATIESRLDSVSAGLIQTCKDMENLSRLDKQSLLARQNERRLEIERKRNDILKLINHNQRQILNLGETIKVNWGLMLPQLKDSVTQWIQNAADYQEITKINMFQGEIQIRINRFLESELTEAARKVSEAVQQELKYFTVPVQELPRLQLRLKQRGFIQAIPPEAGSAGIVAFTFIKAFGHGFFAILGSLPTIALTLVLSPVINKIFSSLQAAVHNITLSAYKTKVIKAFDEQYWPEIDNLVRKTINEGIQDVQSHVESALHETLRLYLDNERSEVSMIDSISREKHIDTQGIQKQLKSIFQGGT